MRKENDPAGKFSDIRKRAQDLLSEPKDGVSAMSPEDIRRLVLELDTYQIELELQNEDLRQAQRELNISRKRFSDLYDFAPVGYLTVSDKGLIIESNLTAADMLGVERGQLLTNSLSAFIADEDQDIHYRCQKKLMETKEQQTCELRMRKKDGSLFHAQLKSIVSSDVDGCSGQSRAVITDISERIQAEEARERARQRLQRAIDGVADPIMVIGLDHEVKLMNSAVRERYVGGGSESGPLYCYGVSHNRDTPCSGKTHSCPLIQVKETMAPALVVHEHYHKNGEKRFYEIIASPMFDENGKLTEIFESASDITERKKMEEELQKARKLESLGVLAGGIAHDFNNLLTSFLGNISLAKMYTEPGSNIFEKLTDAEKASVRARDLTQQLLTFSKGGAPIKMTASISETIKDSASFTLRGSNVRCEYSMPDDLWPAVVDKGQISQVIQNLANNADQAMPEGGTIRIQAKNVVIDENDVLPLSSGKYIKISIQDHGCGIPEEYLDKIFDPYFSTKRKGSGLGLATCYSIIHNHEGSITVESKPGVGTTFRVFLPASERETVPENEIQEEIQTGNGRILIMDDEEAVRQVSADILSCLGYEVELAGHGIEAIDRCAKARETGRPFDAVIMDLTIPGGMGGKEAVYKLREIDPDVKTIVSSGYADDPIMAEHRKHGFDGVIPKPYKVKELGDIVHKVLSGR